MMKRYRLLPLSLCLTLMAAPLFIGCGDKLLPPEGNDSTIVQNNRNKITLKGEIVQEAPLPENTKVVLLWRVSATSSDYLYVYGSGEIDRTNMTFEINLNQPPPAAAVNWYGQDTGFGAAMVLAVSSSMPEGVLVDPAAYPAYGAVNYSNLLYFSTDPEWWRRPGNNGCYDWTEQFKAGYRFGAGLPAPGGCSFDGFVPTPSQSLRLIISNSPDRFTGVNWT